MDREECSRYNHMLSFQVFHVACFSCSACDKHLIPGDSYSFNDGKLICKNDYELLHHEPLDSPGTNTRGCGLLKGRGRSL